MRRAHKAHHKNVRESRSHSLQLKVNPEERSKLIFVSIQAATRNNSIFHLLHSAAIVSHEDVDKIWAMGKSRQQNVLECGINEKVLCSFFSGARSDDTEKLSMHKCRAVRSNLWVGNKGPEILVELLRWGKIYNHLWSEQPHICSCNRKHKGLVEMAMHFAIHCTKHDSFHPQSSPTLPPTQ